MATSEKVFGHFDRYPVGSTFANRKTLSQSGLHTPGMQGISGNKQEGANSIVVSGGYVDDEDYGDEIVYTGAGGNDPKTKRQVADQSLQQAGNAGLVTSQLQGLPVRVIRGAAGDPVRSPAAGFRYDGLFQVTHHWSQIGRDGYRIWRFRLEQMSDLDAGSWAPQLPSGYLQPGLKRQTVARVVRNTAVANSVKKLYGDACQICGVTLEVPGGKASEGAHIRGLGRPHLGPDSPDNVLCLCPNHHTLFDCGGVFIEDDLVVYDMHRRRLADLVVHPGHEIDRQHLLYHRQCFGFD